MTATAVAFPTLAPSSRQYTFGDWPVAKFQSQNGSEARILYGNRRVGHTLSLEYQNITDAQAKTFYDHYAQNDVKGSYKTFAIPANGQNLKDSVAKGWAGDSNGDFFAAGSGVMWRYAEPPAMNQIYPGVSTVRIKLVAVGNAQ